MSSLDNILICRECQKTAKRDDDAWFYITLEWDNKASAIERIKKTKCPTCGSEDWYFSDMSEH